MDHKDYYNRLESKKEEERKQLILMLTQSARRWIDGQRIRHTELIRAEFQKAFEAGWNAREKLINDDIEEPLNPTPKLPPSVFDYYSSEC